MPVLNTPLFDTWTFDGTRWTDVHAARHPPASGRMVFDPFSKTTLLVANASTEVRLGSAPPERTWSWDGSTWRPLHPRSEVALSARVAAMAANPANGTIVAVTACCGGSGPTATWTWNGSTWSPRHPSTELPAGFDLVMAYDPASRRVLAVGNDGAVGAATTWAWDGATWTALQPKVGAVFDPITATIATDPRSRSLVLLATIDGIAGTEVWNGSTWVDDPGLGPSGSDTAHDTAAMYYDDAMGRLVLVSSTADDFREEWMWTGESWLQFALA